MFHVWLKLAVFFLSQDTAQFANKCKFGHNSSFDTVQEHGVIFHYTPLVPQDSKKSPPALDYWVVG